MHIDTITPPCAGTDSAGDGFKLAVDTIPGLVWTSRVDGHIDFLNQRWRDYTGLSLDEASGWGWQQAVLPEDLPGLLAYWSSVLASADPGETEARLRRHDGEFRWFLFRAVPLLDASGTVLKWYGTNTDIEDRKRAEALLAGEKRILEMIAKGQPLERTLDALCRLIGELSPGSLCSILLVDWEEHCFRHGAAPDLPESYNQAMDGRIFATNSGACARAAQQGEQVIVPDIAGDPVWVDQRELPLSHGLKACWSTPVFSENGEVLGVFATYSRTPCLPTAHQLHLIDQLTDITSIAIERSRAAAALQASKHLARGQLNALTRTLDALAPESEPDRFLEHVLATITEQLGAHSCSVWRREETSGLVAFEFAYENGGLVTKSDAVIASISPTLAIDDVWPWPEVFRTGKPYLLDDIREGPRFPWREHVLSLGVVTILIVPMLISGDVEGVIGIRFTSKRDFHAGETDLAQALANQAMLAIQLTRLSAQSRQSAVIAERNRMARDIHDTLAQGFTGIIVQLDAAGDAKARGMLKESDEHVARASELARDSLGEARRSVRALRPLALEEKTLPRALEELFHKMTAGTPLRLEFSLSGESRELPPEWEDNLLRVGQEVLTNALRHADAAVFKTSVTFAPDGFSMDLCDDGRGFEPMEKHDGFGLTGIRERVEGMAGKLLLRSAPDGGTAVRIELNTR
jgi:PAS domain S-box-containing protein